MVFAIGFVFAVPVAAADDGEARKAAEAIERMLQRHGPDVHRCFEKALADRLDSAGKIEIEIDVGAGASVKKARVLAQGKAVSPTFAACVEGSAAGWKAEGLEVGAAVVLPFSFASQVQQFVVKVADVPDRGPAAPKTRGGPPKQPPFTVKVLADEVNVRARGISLTRLSVGPASRVAMHRHPRSAKALYLLEGRARILGPSGTEPMKLEPGMVLFVPAGYPHVIENMGRQATAVFLQIFSPSGPERAYRDPTNAEARVDFEVIRDLKGAKAPEGANLVLRKAEDAPSLSILGGKGSVRILLEPALTGSTAFSVNLIEFSPGSEAPRHVHAGSTELLYVLSGGGTLEVGSESHPFSSEQVLHVPADQPHGGKFAAGEKTVAVQIYSPAGPEQRFRPPVPGAR